MLDLSNQGITSVDAVFAHYFGENGMGGQGPQTLVLSHNQIQRVF